MLRTERVHPRVEGFQPAQRLVPAEYGRPISRRRRPATVYWRNHFGMKKANRVSMNAIRPDAGMRLPR